MGLHVLLYWPNITGYIRIGLVFAAWAAYETPTVFVCLYSVFITLDGLDGWLARRLGQTSRFGAWLDVVVDNLGRGMLWSLLFQWGWLVSALEWCVFLCNHSMTGDHWKSSFITSPPFIRAVMTNGFRTPLGTWVVSGLHCLPLWLYGGQQGFYLPLWIQVLGTLLLAAGRLLALPVEVERTCDKHVEVKSCSLCYIVLYLQLWCIWTHIRYLTSDEPEEKD